MIAYLFHLLPVLPGLLHWPGWLGGVLTALGGVGAFEVGQEVMRIIFGGER